MKKILVFFSIFISLHALGDDCNCQSQLMRVDIEGQMLENSLTGSTELSDIAMPSLEKFLASDTFKSSIVRDYPMQAMGFPFNAKSCETEKEQGDQKFKNVDCKNSFLCSDPQVSEDVKNELCVSLPCAMIKGSKYMGQCSSDAKARPVKLHYTEPIGVKKLEMKPISIEAQGNTLKACFDMSALEVTAALDVEFQQDPNVNYDKLGIKNVQIDLDGNREICMSADLNLGSSRPLSNIKIEKKAKNFVSDNMINKALAASEIHGLSGYSPATLSVLKLTALPPLARYFRPSVEDAIQGALAQTFETQISGWINHLGDKSSPTKIETPSNSFVSEMGVANFAVKKYVDLMECSLLLANKQSIPSDHACLNQVYPSKDKPLRIRDIPDPKEASDLLVKEMNHYNLVTSESLKQRLLNLQELMKSPELAETFQNKILPIIKKITTNQDQSSLIDGVQILTKFGEGDTMSGGVSLLGICDVLNPSPHQGRKIPDCPIQVYLDLNELNNLMTSMYNSGRLCHSGKGDFVPELDSHGRINRNRDGSPRGSGCLYMIEESKDGMRCFLNGAPQLTYDPQSGGYRVQLKTKECFRGSVLLGQGKIAGDINFDIGFTPAICGNGDFCLEDGNAKWNVVPGTARYALKESSWFNGIVKRTIDKKLNEILGQTIRVPLSAGTGPMSMVPLKAEGRIDKGPGFFGACLETK